MPTKNLTSDTQVTSVTDAQTILCDSTEIDKIIDEFGTYVTLRVVSKTFTAEYGDATESYSDNEVKAFMSHYSEFDADVREGIYKQGDITFTFKKDQIDNVKVGNHVKYIGSWYEIERLDYDVLAGVIYGIRALVKRI